jgi:predicted RNA-binding Zn-ribbon protein involved in translation (DUF1610 family)
MTDGLSGTNAGSLIAASVARHADRCPGAGWCHREVVTAPRACEHAAVSVSAAPPPPPPPIATLLPILRCASCNAPLVLDGSERAACPSCGTASSVPAPYRDMVAARRTDDQLHREGEQLVTSLAAPPRLATKLLARMFDLHMLGFLIVYGVPVGLASLFLGNVLEQLLVARHLYPSIAAVPDWLYLTMSCACLFVLTLLPRVLGVYANRRAADRAAVIAALAAKPPATPGGPAECRACGAPLAVVPGQVVARCSYCGTDSAVAVDPALIAATKSKVSSLGATIAEAAAVDREQRVATRGLLARELRRYTFRVAFVTVGWACATMKGPDGGASPVGIGIGFVTLCGAVVFLIRSMNQAEADDAAGRRSLNDAPGWIIPIGAVIAWGGCWELFRLVA